MVRRITSDVAIRALQKALESQPTLKGELILHSNQDTQYTSKAFIDVLEKIDITHEIFQKTLCGTLHYMPVHFRKRSLD